MTKPNSKNPAENIANAQEEIDLAYLQQFAEEILQSGFPKNSRKGSQILDAIPKKLQEYLLEIKKIATEKAQEKDVKDDKLSPEEKSKKIEKRKQSEARVAKIAQEIFISACASNKTLDQALEFHQKLKLGVKELNDFGENGLSPLAAAMLSGKTQDDLNKLLDKGANINQKSPSGLTVLDLAVLTQNEEMAKFLTEKGGKLSLISSEKEQEEGLGGEGRSRQRSKISASKNQSNNNNNDDLKKELESSKQSQLQLDEASAALELHQLEMIKLRNEAQKKNEQVQLKSEQKKTEQEEEKLKNDPDQKKEESVKEDALAKALGINSAEKIDINKLLFNAVKNGNPTLALLLVSFGGDVNHKENGKSVLGAAVEGGNNSLIATLSSFSNPDTKKNALETNVGNENLSRLLASDSGYLAKQEIGLEVSNKSLIRPAAEANKTDDKREANVSAAQKPNEVVNPSNSCKPLEAKSFHQTNNSLVQGN
jgi:hypothetical protein